MGIEKHTNLIIRIVVVIAIAYLVYVFLKSQGLIKNTPPTSTNTTPECPRGPYYTRGLFGECDPNYEMRALEGDIVSGGRCVCISQKG